MNSRSMAILLAAATRRRNKDGLNNDAAFKSRFIKPADSRKNRVARRNSFNGVIDIRLKRIE